MDSRDNIKHVVIVGAGINGLIAAYELVRWGLDVTIVERKPSLGGQAAAIGYGEWHADVAFHRFSLGDYKVQELANELDIGEIFEYPAARNAIYLGGQHHYFGRPVDCLGIESLPFMVRVQLALQMLRTKLWPMPLEQMERSKAVSWILETASSDVYKQFWKPYLQARFKQDMNHVSAAWACRKLLSFGENTDSVGRQNVVCFSQGFSPVLNRLKEKIDAFGGKFRLSSCVTGVAVEDELITSVTIEKGEKTEELACDAVFMAVPVPVCAQIFEGNIPETHTEKLKQIPYSGNITVTLETSGAVTDTYITHVADDTKPFSMIVEHTNLVSTKNFEGSHLIYLSVYLAPDHDMFNQDDAMISAKARGMLAEMFPAAVENLEINHISVFKEKYVHPVPVMGLADMIAECRMPLKNVVIGSMGIAIPEESGVETAIHEARKNSASLLSILKNELA